MTQPTEDRADNPLYLTDKTIDKVCREVGPEEDVVQFAADMVELMLAQRGVGLAANQDGDDRRIIAVNVPGWHRGVFINPRITKRCCGTVNSPEGCLSFPGRKAVVPRDKQVTFEALQLDGTPFKQKLRGLAAIVVQHEIDHLDGVTIFQRGRELA